MDLYDKLLKNREYLDTVKKIENIRFITDGKWDWEHGLGHYKRVSEYVQRILVQLQADERNIELGKIAALLHDIGLIKGDKINHAVESSKIFTTFIDLTDISEGEIEILRQAIFDHSKGNNIESLVGLALVLADKLDVTYHRTENSSIQDTMNKEIQKIKNVDIEIDNKNLIVKYTTLPNFNVQVLQNWVKAIIIPQKAARYLNKQFKFFVNNNEIEVEEILNRID